MTKESRAPLLVLGLGLALLACALAMFALTGRVASVALPLAVPGVVLTVGGGALLASRARRRRRQQELQD
jgi:ABC-type Na+ efflux pump permease subunit